MFVGGSDRWEFIVGEIKAINKKAGDKKGRSLCCCSEPQLTLRNNKKKTRFKQSGVSTKRYQFPAGFQINLILFIMSKNQHMRVKTPFHICFDALRGRNGTNERSGSINQQVISLFWRLMSHLCFLLTFIQKDI